MMDRACLYYKLTNEPKGSGELINIMGLVELFLHLRHTKGTFNGSKTVQIPHVVFGKNLDEEG